MPDYPKLKGIAQNNWFVLFKTVKVMKDKEYAKGSVQTEMSKEIWQLNIFDSLFNPELKNMELEYYL